MATSHSPVVSRLDPTIKAFVDALEARGGPPLHELPVADARAVLEGLQAGGGSPIPVDIEEHTIPVGVGPIGTVGIRVVRPKGSAGPLPVVMYFHGGGWILGSERTHDRLVRRLAIGAQAAIVFVNYTPSPEAQFPAPLDQAFAATRYIGEHGEGLGLDPSRLAVAGDSVGGNMATVVARLAREHGGPAICFQALFYPATDARMSTPSYRQLANGPWLTKAAMKWFFDAYAPRLADRASPLVSPLRASLEELRGLPAALVIVAENDVLRDEGEAYAHRLMQAGVPVKGFRSLGAIHDFMMLDAIAEAPPVRSALALACTELRAALAR